MEASGSRVCKNIAVALAGGESKASNHVFSLNVSGDPAYKLIPQLVPCVEQMRTRAYFV